MGGKSLVAKRPKPAPGMREGLTVSPKRVMVCDIQ